MQYKFKNNVDKWLKEQKIRNKIPKNTIIIPSSRELFFEGKLYEIYLRYQSARTMLNAIDNNENGYWYDDIEENKDLIRLNYNGFFLESMIMNYNIIIDLTWVVTFLSIEICDYEIKSDGNFNFSDGNDISKTKEIIKKIEGLAKRPDDREISEYMNYFNSLSEKYIPITEHIKSFWKTFKDSEIRKLYNFIKHRGKPEYKEIYNITGRKFYSYISDEIEYSTDISDIRSTISLYETLNNLIYFDDNTLFEYCDKLFELLIAIVY